MNELETDKLQFLLRDETLLTALHKVFNQVIEEYRPTVGNESNTILGEKYRAYELSKQILAAGFRKLDEFQIESESESVGNRAV